MARKRKKKKIALSKKSCIFITSVVVTLGLILIVINRTIVKEPEYEINFHDAAAEILIGEKVRFGYTILNSTGEDNLVWTTSNSKVATVDATGEVRGVSFGDVIITVQLANGNSSSIKVRVKSYPVYLIVNTDLEPTKGWYRQNINVTIDTLNIEEMKYCVTTSEECYPNQIYKNKITLGNGIWYLYISYVDRNGKEGIHREVYNIDSVVPKCDIARIGKFNEEESTIDVICGKDASGIEKYEWYRDGKRVYVTDQNLTYVKEFYEVGKHKYAVRVYDVAGNSIEYKIDN